MNEKEKINSDDKYSLQARVFKRIREDILNGKLKKDDELKEVTLGKQYGVSRTPIREALRQLELEGLVKIVQNKGAYVVGLSSEDIKDIYEMRSRLEGLCARWAARKASEEVILKLEETIELSEFYCNKGRFSNVVELDNEFHERLYDAADSKMLYHTLSGFHHYLECIRKQTLSDKNRIIKSTSEHKDIVKAIKARDEDKADELAKIHMINTIKNIEAHNLW